MNLQQAKDFAASIAAKTARGEDLTTEDLAQMEQAKTVMTAAALTGDPTETIRNQVHASLAREELPPGKVKVLGLSMSPTIALVVKTAGFVGACALSAFAGIKYEQRRQGRQTNDNLLGLGNIGDGVGQHHVDSPQSHPATSPDDQRLAQNRPTTTQRRQTANA